MKELSEIQKYILTQFQLLPFSYFSAEELQVIFNMDDITVLHKVLSVLSKKRFIVKKNKKYSPKKNKSDIITEIEDKTLLEIQLYLNFLQGHINFDSNELLKYKEIFSSLAINYFKLFTCTWNKCEIQLLNDTLLFLFRTGQLKKANLLFREHQNIKVKNQEEFDFLLSYAKSLQLKNRAKFVDALNTLILNKHFIESCTKADNLTHFFLFFFYLLRTNARQSESMDLFNEALLKLEKMDASKVYFDRLLFGKANIYLDLNQPKKAIEILEEVIESQLGYLEKLHPYLAECYASLGTAYHFLGNSELAIQYSLTALEILDFNYDTPSNEKTSIHFTLASAYLTSENYGLAREEIEITIKATENLSPKYHPDNSIYRSVDILLSKWKYPDAVDSMKKEFKKVKKYFSSNHPIIGFFHNNLAMLYSESKKYEKSNQHLLKAYRINYNLYNKDTVNQAMLLSNMALNFESINQYDEALGLLKRAEKILIKHFGENHPDIAKLFQAYAQVYTQIFDNNKALFYLKKASTIIEYYNKEHPSLVAIYSNMALNYQNMDKYKKAKELVLKAYELYGAFYSGKVSFMEVRLLNTLASISRKINDGSVRGEYSLKAYNKLIEIWNELLIENELLSVAYITCDNLFYDNKLKESRKLTEQLESSVRYSFMLQIPIENKTLAAIYNSIAMNAAAENEISYAINYMFKAVHILHRIKKIPENYLGGYYASLVELLIRSEYHREQAIPYLQKLIKIEHNKFDSANPRVIVNYNRSLAAIYMHLKQIDKSIQYYQIALKLIIEEESLSNMQHTMYLEIGHAYTAKRLLTKAIDYNLRALHAFYQTSNKHVESEASIMMQIASSYFYNAQYKLSLVYGHEAEHKLEKKSDNLFAKVNAYSLLSSVYNDVGDKKMAKKYILKLNQNLKSPKIPTNSVFTWLHKYRYARQLASDKNFSRALDVSEKLIETMNSVDFFNDLYIDIANFIIELKEIINEYK